MITEKRLFDEKSEFITLKMFFFKFAVSVECLLPLQKWYNASPYSASECRNRVSDFDLLSFFIIIIIFLSKNNQDWHASLGSKKKTHLVWSHSFKFICSTLLESLKLDNIIKEHDLV